MSNRYSLHVLRHPSSTGERGGEAYEMAGAPGVLREVLDRADAEYRNVLREGNEAFYYGVATPTVLGVGRQVAHRLRTSLHLKEAVFGVWGPTRILHGGAVYSIWIQHQLCG